MTCPHCGEPVEPDDLLHDLTCNGQQGAVEALAEPPLEPVPPPLAPAQPPAPVLRRIANPRPTSVQAFYAAIANGTIKTRQQQAYTALRERPSSTAAEVFAYLKEARHLGPRYDSNTNARLTELRDLGVIREAGSGSKVCTVTGQTAIAWEVVPADEYLGPAIVHRCEACGQIIARDVPTAREA